MNINNNRNVSFSGGAYVHVPSITRLGSTKGFALLSVLPELKVVTKDFDLFIKKKSSVYNKETKTKFDEKSLMLIAAPQNINPKLIEFTRNPIEYLKKINEDRLEVDYTYSSDMFRFSGFGRNPVFVEIVKDITPVNIIAAALRLGEKLQVLKK